MVAAVSRTACEIIEGALTHPNDVLADEPRSFPGAVLWMSETAFPLDHSPARKVILSELGKNPLKVDLTVAE